MHKVTEKYQIGYEKLFIIDLIYREIDQIPFIVF